MRKQRIAPRRGPYSNLFLQLRCSLQCQTGKVEGPDQSLETKTPFPASPKLARVKPTPFGGHGDVRGKRMSGAHEFCADMLRTNLHSGTFWVRLSEKYFKEEGTEGQKMN